MGCWGNATLAGSFGPGIIDNGMVEHSVSTMESSASVGSALYVAESYPYFLRSVDLFLWAGSRDLVFPIEFPAIIRRDTRDTRS